MDGVNNSKIRRVLEIEAYIHSLAAELANIRL